jgi:1,4-alpha-glucan branching enzyme
MMGWMHDTLNYMKRPPIYRKYHQNEITFSIVYAFTENFMLPLSHDEVVYGKGSILGRMPGDEWQRFANLRALYGYMFTHPGTQLLFMGSEFGQGGEWNFEQQLDWWLLDSPTHKGIQDLIKDLNHLNKNTPAIYEKAFSNDGFEWLAYDDGNNSVISYIRKGEDGTKPLIVVCHFSPQVLYNYEIGVSVHGTWKQVLNTDDKKYGGSDVQNIGILETTLGEKHGKDSILSVTIPPLAVIAFELVEEKPKPKKKAAKKKTA